LFFSLPFFLSFFNFFFPPCSSLSFFSFFFISIGTFSLEQERGFGECVCL
jgi:hypothetical protein